MYSTGMDACEHEHEGMSRHGRKVPVSFFERFTKDAKRLADKYSRGRIVSVLEGGYSDRALTSGALAHLAGLAVDDADPDWWSLDNLVKVRHLHHFSNSHLTFRRLKPEQAPCSKNEEAEHHYRPKSTFQNHGWIAPCLFSPLF